MWTIGKLKERGYIIHDLPVHWKKIINTSFKKDKLDGISEINYEKLDFLTKEYIKKGYISSHIFKELLGLSDSVIILFYTYLYGQKLLGGERPEQIAKTQNNTNWVAESDYCFINIRALGEEVSDTGNIINATKFLPALRVGGIHLAPFFECKHGIIYCQDSFYRINREIVNLFYEKEGVTPIEQMQFFIDCIHVLGMAVGFDVTPHTCQMSKLSLDRPELFRWIRFNPKKDGLYDQMRINAQYDDSYQELCEEHIRNLAGSIKKQYGIENIEDTNTEYELSNKVADLIRKAIAKEGYYTVPPHTWNGICIPDYKGFSELKEMPLWDYRDINGEDQGQHAIWMHACLYIHKGMHANQLPSQVTKNEEDGYVERNDQVIAFFKDYLRQVIHLYGFDYIRMDYVDHIFDNVTYIDGKEIAINEMLTPREILEIITELRKEYKGLGLQADHLGNDAKLFETAGFNLIIGGEVGSNMSRMILQESFHGLLRGQELQGKQCRSTYAIDTHDMAHPLFRGKELAHREGKVGVLGRLFISRFANVGFYRRPKYEVIGNQDLSSGIHRANNRAESLVWESNREVFRAYHDIEDLYDNLKERLAGSYLSDYTLLKNHIAWTIKNEERKVIWICIMPILYLDGFACDDTFIREHEIEGELDRYYYNFEHSLDENMIQFRVCTTIKNLKFNEESIPNKDVVDISSIEDSQLEIIMKTRGFVMLEIEEIRK